MDAFKFIALMVNSLVSRFLLAAAAEPRPFSFISTVLTLSSHSLHR